MHVKRQVLEIRGHICLQDSDIISLFTISKAIRPSRAAEVAQIVTADSPKMKCWSCKVRIESDWILNEIQSLMEQHSRIMLDGKDKS
jgi:hypothetical protein